MRHAFFSLILLGFGVAIGAGGYWFSQHGFGMSSGSTAGTATEAAAAERKVLYYRDPMGKPDYSAEPKKDAMGMDYIPVHEGEDESAPPSSPPPAAASGVKGRILYYRNPMGLPDTSPVPKKDSMGMDYIPVTEGEETDDTGTVKISPDRVQKLGVQTAAVAPRVLTRTIRAVGTVQADERRLYTINTKFEGWIEKLYVNATGQTVSH
jgi:membrane fusion protein, copper/silver efflux system